MKSKEEFIKRWQIQMIGLAMFGATSDRNDGPYAKASRILYVPAEMNALLSSIYDDIDPLCLPNLSVEDLGKLFDKLYLTDRDRFIEWIFGNLSGTQVVEMFLARYDKATPEVKKIIADKCRVKFNPPQTNGAKK
jgi:hypothetical protein